MRFDLQGLILAPVTKGILMLFRSYVPERVRTHRVLASSITLHKKKDLIAKRSDATASHNEGRSCDDNLHSERRSLS